MKFTPLELRELGELEDVDIVLHQEDFGQDSAELDRGSPGKQLAVIERIFAEWRCREVGGASRRLHFHFFAKPLELVGSDGVEAFRYERTEMTSLGEIVSTGEVREQKLQALYYAVGYFGSPLSGIPFDVEQGVIPNTRGAVLDDTDDYVRGIFVTGWIKRGPIGLIGHTKSDAKQTIDTLLELKDSLWTPERTDPDRVVDLLTRRGCKFTGLSGWQRLDREEMKLGKSKGKERQKVVSRNEMLRLSSPETRQISV